MEKFHHHDIMQNSTYVNDLLHTTPFNPKHNENIFNDSAYNYQSSGMRNPEFSYIPRLSECPTTIFLPDKVNKTISQFQKNPSRIPFQEIPFEETKKSSVFRKISFGENEIENGFIQSLPR